MNRHLRSMRTDALRGLVAGIVVAMASLALFVLGCAPAGGVQPVGALSLGEGAR